MTEPIQLVEQHIIKPNDPRFEPIDRAAFASKNLYNAANYIIRQEFIFKGRYIPFAELFHLVKHSDAYKALPRKVSNLVLRQLDQNWRAFLAALKEWKMHPEKFLGRPNLPGYKDKAKGRNLLVYDTQALSKPALRQGIIKPSQLGITIETKQQNVDQVRIVPRKGHYVVEVVYTVEPAPAELDDNLAAGVDIGLNNLATITSNKPGFRPLVVNGRPLKSINQYYNKTKAALQSLLPGNRRTSRRITELSNKRNRKVKHYLHVASKRVVDRLVKERIGILVIGKNDNWKQKINIGRQNNQNFAFIPFADFINMLTYKARLVGIKVVIQEESYTSKCSFLDLEPIRKQASYLGKRVKRGLFIAGNGRSINADVNGSYNIIRKATPNAFGNGVEGVAVHPSSLRLLVNGPYGTKRHRIRNCSAIIQ